MASTDAISESTLRAMRAYTDAIAARDTEAMVACWEPGSIDTLVGTRDLRAPEDIRDWFDELFAAFPDTESEVVEMLASGARGVFRWRMSCSFTGDPRGAGTEAPQAGFAISRARSGRTSSIAAATPPLSERAPDGR